MKVVHGAADMYDTGVEVVKAGECIPAEMDPECWHWSARRPETSRQSSQSGISRA